MTARGVAADVGRGSACGRSVPVRRCAAVVAGIERGQRPRCRSPSCRRASVVTAMRHAPGCRDRERRRRRTPWRRRAAGPAIAVDRRRRPARPSAFGAGRSGASAGSSSGAPPPSRVEDDRARASRPRPTTRRRSTPSDATGDADSVAGDARRGVAGVDGGGRRRSRPTAPVVATTSRRIAVIAGGLGAEREVRRAASPSASTR